VREGGGEEEEREGRKPPVGLKIMREFVPLTKDIGSYAN
jgi:hypothetical protein